MIIDWLDLNKKRINRAGKELWNFMTTIKAGDCVTGERAMMIKDTYGLRPSDLIFFLSILGATVDIEEFDKLLEVERNQPPNVKCFHYDH